MGAGGQVGAAIATKSAKTAVPGSGPVAAPVGVRCNSVERFESTAEDAGTAPLHKASARLAAAILGG
jgi:hypothetical protein